MARRVQFSTSPPNFTQPTDGSILVCPQPIRFRSDSIVTHSLFTLAQSLLNQHGLSLISPDQRLLQLGELRETLPEGHPFRQRSLKSSVILLTELMSQNAQTPAQISEDARLWFGVIEQYRKRLSTQHLVDASDCFHIAVTLAVEVRKVIIQGYIHLSEAEIRFINHIAADGSTVVLPELPDIASAKQASALTLLAKSGWETPQYQSQTVSLDPASSLQLSVNEYSSVAHEVEGLCQKLKVLLNDGEAPQKIVIACRDPEVYHKPLLRAAQTHGISLDWRFSESLDKHPLADGLRCLMEAIEAGWRYEPGLIWAEHPLNPNLPDLLSRTIREQHPNRLSAWQALDIPGLSQFMTTRFASRDTWASLAKQWLVSVPAPSNPNHNDAALASWQEAQERLENSLSSASEQSSERITAGRMLRHWQGLWQSMETLPTAQKNTIAVVPPTSLWAEPAEHVWILGVVEGVYPRTLDSGSIIDFKSRSDWYASGISVKTFESMALDEQLIWRTSIASSLNSLTLSFPVIMAGRETEPSRYLTEYTVSRPQEFLDDDETSLPLELQARLAVERQRASAEGWNEYSGYTAIGIDWVKRKFSATQLTQLGQCGFRWWLGYVLMLDEPEELDEGLNAMQKGILYHRTLELALTGISNPPSAKAIQAAIPEAFSTAEKEQRLDTLTNWAMQRREHLKRLHWVVAQEPFLADTQSILKMEVSFQGNWRGFQVGGKIDRIDQTTRGLTLIDYKTSATRPKGAQDSDRRLSLDIQLVLYVEAALAALYPDQPIHQALYLSLRNGKDLGTMSAPDPARYEHLERRLKTLLETGWFTPQPDSEEAACSACQLAAICRRDPWVHQKPGLTLAAQTDSEAPGVSLC